MGSCYGLRDAECGEAEERVLGVAVGGYGKGMWRRTAGVEAGEGTREGFGFPLSAS